MREGVLFRPTFTNLPVILRRVEPRVDFERFQYNFFVIFSCCFIVNKQVPVSKWLVVNHVTVFQQNVWCIEWNENFQGSIWCGCAHCLMLHQWTKIESKFNLQIWLPYCRARANLELAVEEVEETRRMTRIARRSTSPPFPPESARRGRRWRDLRLLPSCPWSPHTLDAVSSCSRWRGSRITSWWRRNSSGTRRGSSLRRKEMRKKGSGSPCCQVCLSV